MPTCLCLDDMVGSFLDRGVGLYASLRWSFTPNARTYIAPSTQTAVLAVGIVPPKRHPQSPREPLSLGTSVSQLVYAARLQQGRKQSPPLEGGVHLITLGGGCAEKKVEPRQAALD